ncbi:MAG: hypothetical protein NT007_15305 [Candidatus Kapabacteria bacterium]|nr:hypothetical protein [Candidatus Kapabacteria bacterium]
MNQLKIAFLCAAFVFIFSGCKNESALPNTAAKLSMNGLKQTSGWMWLGEIYNSYKTDSALILKIKAAFKPGVHRIYCFTNLTCSCAPNIKVFGNCLRTMTDAGISETNFEIYSMPDTSYSYPYSTKFKINFIPAVFIMKDSIVVYSVIDSFMKVQDINLDSNLAIEPFLYQGLLK